MATISHRAVPSTFQIRDSTGVYTYSWHSMIDSRHESARPSDHDHGTSPLSVDIHARSREKSVARSHAIEAGCQPCTQSTMSTDCKTAKVKDLGMDANQWKLLVDKVILRTKSRDLLWSRTDEGPAKTLSFGVSFGDDTRLNIWGYKNNYSYELLVIKETSGEPFIDRKRVTVKKNAEGINFNGLFETAKKQIEDLTRERAFAALMDYLANPTADDRDMQQDFLDPWEALGHNNYFSYAQDEEILTKVRDMTAAGSIIWTIDDGESLARDGQSFFAEVGAHLYLSFYPRPLAGGSLGATTYLFIISSMDDSDSDTDIEMKIRHTAKGQEQPSWLLAVELNTIILKNVHENEAKFNKIVLDNVFHEILESLDRPRKEPSSSGGN